MAINYPGPYELRVNYITAIATYPTLEHQLRVSCDMSIPADPGDPFSDWVVKLKNGGTQALNAVVDAFVLKLKAAFDANADIIDCELWEYEAGTFNAAFKSVYAIAVAGTNGGTATVDGQAILTFRSSLGGSARIDVRRPVVIAGPTQGFPTTVTWVNDLADYVISGSSPIVARDGGYLFAKLHYLPGANEAYFKKRNRI